MTSRVGIQRVYGRQPTPGTAVLVDRVWPRGIRKEDLGSDLWMRDLGPSTELRKWFAHRPDRWDEFRLRYRAELQLAPQQALLDQLVELARKQPLTLLYGARDTERNQALVIRELLDERLGA